MMDMLKFWKNKIRVNMQTWIIYNEVLNSPIRVLIQKINLKFFPRSHLKDFSDKHPCVFFLSTGRVGTVTLSHLCGLAKNVFAYHEPYPNPAQMARIAYQLVTQKATNEIAESALREGFLTARRELMDYSLYCQRGYVETGPLTTFLAPLIPQCIPAVKFIHLVRDPKKFARSVMRRKWNIDHPNDKRRITPVPDSAFGQKWEGFSPLEKNLWLWSETNRYTSDFIQTLPTGRGLLVHSEEVFAANPDTITSVFNFIGSNPPSARKIKRILGRQLNEQVEGTFKEPEDWLAELDKELARFVQETAAGLGYEFS
jgi:hypothetical protein